ncbi:transmembrane protein 249-like [Exaiptasia diaphana]|uniref:Transmembrane protein 249 n=1 Tax=Exaiptasia diaphana TaxID=2652724 RepID=A0A913Y736_EXADI|nr:transmembrane protein 249-like [Exaiptasia diaphana]
MVLWKAIKNLEILEKPESIFNRRLIKNPCYPFNKDHDGKFVLHLDRRRCYYGIFMSVVCALIVTVWLIVSEAGQYLMFPILIGCISAWFAFENKADRICTLDSLSGSYTVTLGGKHVQEGEIRNVYIRLKAQKHGAGHKYYYVVFNGYHVTEQKVTSYSKNDKRLRTLAKRLAENLDLNYFDIKASSKEHVIRHRPKPSARAEDEVVNNGYPV